MDALYLHVPHRLAHPSAFVAAACHEMELCAEPPFTDAPVRMLYVGGGRPSHLSPSALRTLVDACRQSFDASRLEEVTVELHPSDASAGVCEALRNLGITRLSIEGRSFVDAELQAVEMSYSAADLRQTLNHALETGFDSVSVDLMFGGPHQSLSTWKASLQRAVDLRVPHVTLHELDAGEGTPREDEVRADCFAFAMTFLRAKGYEQYELTHFARPGHHSRYQSHVYAHGNVLGLGPGAESFWWPERDSGTTAERWSNVTNVAAYVERLHDDEAPVARRETLDRPALAREYILLRLRTNDGLDLAVLENRYDCPLRRKKHDTLERLAAEGLIHHDPPHVRLTERGRLLTDAITQRLIHEG